MRSISTSIRHPENQLSGLAGYLIQDGFIDIPTAHAAQHAADDQGMSLTRYLVQATLVTSDQILQCCIKHFNLPVFDMKQHDPSWFRQPVIPPELICRYRVIPLNRDGHTLCLGVSDPTNHHILSIIGFHCGLRLQPYLISESELDRVINLHCQNNLLTSQLESTLSKISPIEENTSQYEIKNGDDGPVSEFVHHLLRDAIDKKVSDIHIEPYEEHCRIRFRRNGLLCTAATIPPHLAARIITFLKIMSQLNIAERRLPQDGRLYLPHDYQVDIRINTCSVLYGEKIVLRILDKKMKPDIHALGMSTAQQELFISRLHQPQGLILVTGPTGSGKTVTLYSALHYLNQIEKNISTVEDPVEIELPGINQININSRIGLDFATALRTLLRQDPDILMVGEIRDSETANIAIQASQTGHLVLSTLHTNNAVESIMRLQTMGIAAYHFINSVSLIIAQRLVRKLCQHCKMPAPSQTSLQQMMALTDCHVIYQPGECHHCHQGYDGRIGLFEIIPITENLAQSILSGASSSQLLAIIKQENYLLLWNAGLEAIRNGLTSYAELQRVINSPE